MKASTAFSVLLPCLLLPAPLLAQVHLRLEAGWDGVARRGGVVPLRVTVRLPDDAPQFPPEQRWQLRVSPQGGPWRWDLVLPVSLVPGSTRVVDAAIALHGDDTALAVALIDPDGQQWSQAAQALALLPSRAQLGAAVGAERGVRRIRDEQGPPAEITWIRLPPHQLPAEPAGWLDLSRLRWEAPHAQPPAAAELGYRQWRAWTVSVGSRAEGGDSVRVAAPPIGTGWQATVEQLDESSARPSGTRKSPVAMVAVAALAVALAVRPAGAGSRRPWRSRTAFGALFLVTAGWLALGAPQGVGRASHVASHSEPIGGGLQRTWEVCRIESGARRRPIAWPRGDVLLIAPLWLPRDSERWELWSWMPGAGEPRWELRPPRRGARGNWLGLAIGASMPATVDHAAPGL